MKSCLIVGGGFSLYGYFPVLQKIKSIKIYINFKYKKFIQSRKDLNIFQNKVIWLDNKNKNFLFDILVFAKRPIDQYNFVKNYKSTSSHFFLEKPLAQKPKAAYKILNILEKKKN